LAPAISCRSPCQCKAFPELLRRSGYYTHPDNKLDYQFSSIAADSGPFSIWDDEGNNAHCRNRNHGQPFFGMINFIETHEGKLVPRPAWARSFLHLAP
jgi:N-sulfoglucosamine sulfohydrolase